MRVGVGVRAGLCVGCEVHVPLPMLPLHPVLCFSVAFCEVVQGVCSQSGVCVGSTGTCVCFEGYRGTDCSACADSYAVGDGGACVFLAGSLSSCDDGLRNGNEVGVDCGGPHCGACAGGAELAARVYAPIVASIALVVLVGFAIKVCRSRGAPGRTKPLASASAASPLDVYADGSQDAFDEVPRNPLHAWR